MLKLFKMNECDWVAAENLDQAKQCLANCIGDGKVDAAFEEDYIEDPYEVGDEHLDTLILTGEEYDDEDDLDEKGEPKRKKDPDQTFRQALAAMSEAGYFASTEC